MARYLLDTNVLVYMILNDLENLSNETINIIFDYNNLIYTSSVAVIEMCQL
jgi:PIN domain nuclease of toxin-antitoxin system